MTNFITDKDELGNQFVKAAVTGDLESLPEILANPNFDPNIKDELDEPIIHSILQLAAADVGMCKVQYIIEAVKMLMRHPMFDADACNSLLETPIMLIAKNKKLNDFADIFLGGEVDVDLLARDIMGDTVEDLALEHGNNELLIKLLNNDKAKKIYLKGIPTQIISKACTN